MATTEARTGAILRANTGVPFCAACLALAVGVSLEIQDLFELFHCGFHGYKVNSEQRCSVCQRVKITISAEKRRRS
jgi:hypothetical protein